MSSGHHWGAVLSAMSLGMTPFPFADIPDLSGDFNAPRTRPRQSDGPHMVFVHAKRFDRKMRRRAIAERSRRFNRGRRP